MTYIDAHIGQRLRRLRQTKDVSVPRLAELLNVSADDVDAMENGRRIDADLLLRICDVLEITADDLHEGLDDEKSSTQAFGLRHTRLSDEPY